MKPRPSLLCSVGYHTDILPRSGAGSWKHGCPCLSSHGGGQCCPRAGRREQVWSSAASWLTALGWQQRCASAVSQPHTNVSTEARAPLLSCHFILPPAEGQCSSILNLAEGQQSIALNFSLQFGAKGALVPCLLQSKEPPACSCLS